MSRIGKQPIPIPDKTEVVVEDGRIRVKGPQGELERTLRGEVKVSVADGVVTVEPARDSRFAKALWGTYASHLKNMIAGVQEPYEKKLIIEGVGYRAELADKTLKLSVGFSHPVVLDIPEGITVDIQKNVIFVRGIDKEKAGQFAAEIRAVKKPEPYKGKGIRYENEVVRRKEGKKTA